MSATTALPKDAGCHFILGQGNWTVRWQARTKGEDGAFRLYAGQDLGNLRFVDMQQARPGVGSYQFKDMPDGSRWLFYQLRFVSGNGEEIVLGTLRVDIEGMTGNPAAINLGNQGLKALEGTQIHPSLISTPNPPEARSKLPDSAAPEPEVPPPRPWAA